jgi:hypothetical protein
MVSPEELPSQEHSELFCPSAPADADGGVLFGVVGGTVENPRVAYLAEPIPVRPEILELSEPARPNEVFRIGAPCAAEACQHYDGDRCSLVRQLVRDIAPVAESVPPCRLRPQCRWWHEEGPAACRRCPLVVTEQPNPSPEMRHAARPAAGTPAEPRPGRRQRLGVERAVE